MQIASLSGTRLIPNLSDSCLSFRILETHQGEGTYVSDNNDKIIFGFSISVAVHIALNIGEKLKSNGIIKNDTVWNWWMESIILSLAI